MANFHSRGNTSFEIDKLTTCVMAGRISFDTSLTTQVLMKSEPVDFEFFRLLMILLTSSGVTGLRTKVQFLFLNTSLSFSSGSDSVLGILALSSLFPVHGPG